MTTTALTYEGIAQRLGITTDSARRLVHRRRWKRSKGNDGRSLIEVPDEFLQHRDEGRTDDADSPTGSPPDSPPGAAEPVLGTVPETALLSDLLARLGKAQDELVDMAHRLGAAERDVEALKVHAGEALKRAEDRDQVAAQRDLATAQVAALTPILEVERKRVEDLKEADRQRTEEVRLRALEAQQRSEELKAERDRWLAAADAAQARIEALTMRAAEAERRRAWWPFSRAG